MQPIRNVFLGIDCFQSNVFFGSVCQVSDLVTVGLPPLNWSNYPPDDDGAGRGFIATTAHLAPPLSTSAADQKYKYSARWFLHRLQGTHGEVLKGQVLQGDTGELYCHNLPLPMNDCLTAGLVRPAYL